MIHKLRILIEIYILRVLIDTPSGLHTTLHTTNG
jgi:hypothetical protein